MPIAHVNGADIHYTDTGAPPGRPDAPTVVFGHGLLFSGWMFTHQVEALKDEYRCVTIDWRSQGKSPAARNGHDMDTLTLDLVALLDELGLDVVHYVGLSMGGYVGMRFAARHPDRVLSLALLDTDAGPEDPDVQTKYRMLATAYRFVGMRPLRKQVVPIMFGPTFRDNPAGQAVIEHWLTQLKTNSKAGMRRAVLGVTDRLPVSDEVSGIRARTIVVVGAHDIATTPVKAEAIATAIDGAKLEIVPDCGHSSTVEQPEVLTRLIREHLAG
ncbi:alpha/beta fold hydrolase [Aeromicrobium sp.]|uniref:alpha/beta fold hydrolase n=1 Tax=Aeromicrobium sp. TaxID=1871063 RepID=UPI003D6B2CC2